MHCIVKRSALVLASIAIIAGCTTPGSSPSGTAASAAPPSVVAASPSPSARTVRVEVILAALDNDFYVAQKEGIETEAAKHSDAEVSVSAGSQRTASTEVIALIENAITKGVDAIAVNGSDNEPLLPALQKVIDAGIPLILFDAPAETLEGKYATYIGTDNRAGGLADGQWLQKALPGGGDVGLLLCVPGHPVTQARVDGFKEGLGTAATYNFVSELDAGCDREIGRKAMEDMITAHADLDAVYSTSDTQTFGALEALEAAKIDPLVVSFDAQPEAVDNIRAGGILDATAGWCAQDLGVAATRAAINAAKGEAVQPSETIPVTVVSKDNVATWAC